MSFKHQVTFVCDSCEQEYMLDVFEETSTELPPGWIGIQVAVADSEGCVPDAEQESFCHFCTQSCLVDYVSGGEMRRRFVATERQPPDDEEENDENK